MLEEGKYEDLAKFDELSSLKVYHDDLKYYEEHPINFRPSYKFNQKAGFLEYEIKKGKLPSYWDRVLFKPNCDLACKSYKWLEICISDHLPVLADFELHIDSSDPSEGDIYRSTSIGKNIKTMNLERGQTIGEDWDEDNLIEIPRFDLPPPVLSKTWSQLSRRSKEMYEENITVSDQVIVRC